MTGGNDPGCRGAFPWDASRWDRDLRSYVRSVLRLRATQPELRHGSTTTVAVAGPAIAFERRLDDARLVVVVNPGTEPVTLELSLLDGGSRRLTTIELEGAGSTGHRVDTPIVDARATVVLPPRTGQVLRATGA
jgi:glycosidase